MSKISFAAKQAPGGDMKKQFMEAMVGGHSVKITDQHDTYKALGASAEFSPGEKVTIKDHDLDGTKMAHVTLSTPDLKPKFGFKEETFYFDQGSSLPNLAGRNPDNVRVVDRVWYGTTSGAWSGFSRSDQFAVRWTGFLDIKSAGVYNLWIQSDDGSKLYIDNQLVVNNDGLHGMKTMSADKNLAVGEHTLRLEMFEKGGGAGMLFKFKGPDSGNTWSYGQNFIYYGKGASSALTSGFMEKVFYFSQGSNLPDLNGRKADMVRTTQRVWYPSTGSAWPGYRTADNFAVRWTGFLNIKGTGSYTFSVSSDDGAKLYIDDSMLVDNDGLHAMRTKEAARQLSADEHSLQLDFFEKGGGAGMQFQFKGPDTNNAWSYGASHINYVKKKGLSSKVKYGWKEELYYVSPSCSMPNLDGRRPDSVMDRPGYIWFGGNGAKWPGNTRAHNFAARWTGILDVKKAGTYTFLLNSDDGSKMYVDGQELVNNDGCHGPRAKQAGKSLSVGAHPLKLDYFQKGGPFAMEFSFKGPDTGDQFAYLAAPYIRQEAPRPASRTTASGFKEEQFYFTQDSKVPNLDGRTPRRVRNVDWVWYGTTSSTWAGYMNSDNFAVRWSGFLGIKTSGLYTLWIASDDGSKLYIDQQLRVNNDGLHGMRSRQGAVELDVGEHPLRLQMFERTGSAGMQFQFKGPDTSNAWSYGQSHVRQVKLVLSGFKEEAYYFAQGSNLPTDLSRRKPDFERDVRTVWYDSSSSAWSGFGRDNDFAVRWTGLLRIKKAGIVLFSLKSDDGSKLWIDSQPVVDNNGLHGMKAKEGLKSLTPGNHPLRLEFFEKGGGAGMQFQFKGPDTNNKWSRGKNSMYQVADGHGWIPVNALKGYEEFGVQASVPPGTLLKGATVDIITDKAMYDKICMEAGLMCAFSPGDKGVVKEIDPSDGSMLLKSDGEEAWIPIKVLTGFGEYPKVTPPTPKPPAAAPAAAAAAPEASGPAVPPGPTTFSSSGCRAIYSQLDDYIEKTSLNSAMGMTLSKCFSYCKKQEGMTYFGVSGGDTCFCAPLVPGTVTNDDHCDMPCSDKKGKCGGNFAADRAASVYTMSDCTPMSPGEAKKEAEDEKAAVVEAFSTFASGTCGMAKENEVEVGGSSKLSGTVDECKAKCHDGEACHGFNYDAVKSECIFLKDVLFGKVTNKPGSMCYFKKVGHPRPDGFDDFPLGALGA
jgi:hypothetical protein